MTSLVVDQRWFSFSEDCLCIFGLLEVDLGGDGDGEQVFHAGPDHVVNIGDDFLRFFQLNRLLDGDLLESRLCVTGVSLFRGGGVGLRGLVELRLVLYCKSWWLVDVARRVRLGQHVNGHAHKVLIEPPETFSSSIGGVDDWQSFI